MNQKEKQNQLPNNKLRNVNFKRLKFSSKVLEKTQLLKFKEVHNCFNKDEPQTTKWISNKRNNLNKNHLNIITKSISSNPIINMSVSAQTQKAKCYKKRRWYEPKILQPTRPGSPVYQDIKIESRSLSKPVGSEYKQNKERATRKRKISRIPLTDQCALAFKSDREIKYTGSKSLNKNKAPVSHAILSTNNIRKQTKMASENTNKKEIISNVVKSRSSELENSLKREVMRIDLTKWMNNDSSQKQNFGKNNNLGIRNKDKYNKGNKSTRIGSQKPPLSNGVFNTIKSRLKFRDNSNKSLIL